ncbi:hypothetical protein NQ317_009640 [Molorchus minor]|uniref:OCIA domain-containing protein n=1 Tax=Molorchus minor TaxID=1323400 RepID=A0ABQ9JYR5_9CUCU|nr:hypothetical protein NQ317_009640 [Molorchus minor]
MINPGEDNEGQPRRPFTGQHTRSATQYKFTHEELQVIRECNRKRCLPLSAVLGGSTYYAVKTGVLTPNARFGAVPKVVAAVIVGYFLASFPYQSKCAAKLMQLPNSQIGEILRQKRRGNLKESYDYGFGPGMSLATFSGMESTDTYSDLKSNNSLDLDTNRPELPGLED